MARTEFVSSSLNTYPKPGTIASSPALDILFSQELDWRDDFHPESNVEKMSERIVTTIWSVNINSVAPRDRFINQTWRFSPKFRFLTLMALFQSPF